MWLYVYAILVAAVVVISIARSLAFFECSFRCALPAQPDRRASSHGI